MPNPAEGRPVSYSAVEEGGRFLGSRAVVRMKPE